jgi:translocation and assembly module TamA
MTLARSAAALLLTLGAACLGAGCAGLSAAGSGAGAAETAAPSSAAEPLPPPAARATLAALESLAAPATAAAPAAAASAAVAAPAGSAAEAAASAPGAALAATGGVQISVAAPPELKALLERHLDAVRLGRLVRDEVDDSEWSRLIDAVPAQVRSLLQTEGYFAPTVMLEREPRRAPGEADIVRLQVQPGPRARISRFTLEPQGELERGAHAGEPHATATLAQLRRTWELPGGAPFRNDTWSAAKAAALARLRAAGYATASWDGTAAEVDLARNEVRLFLVVDSGPLFRYGSLQIEGLAAHDTDTVENLLAAQRGAPVTETLLLDFQDRLQKSGLFEGVNVTLDPDPATAGTARIVARAQEAPLQVYTFGVGISANNGPRASVEHLYRRVFGYAASSRVKIELGKKRQAWDGEVTTHPLQGLYRYLVGGSVERLLSDDDAVLSQRVRLGRTQDKSSVERLHFAEFERSLRTTQGGERNDSVALSLNFHGAWRDLDSLVLPTRGVSLAVQVGAGGSRSNAGVDGSFSRAYGRLTGYLPLGQSWYGQARLELGQVFAADRVAVPESQKWRAGGDESVRGYGYRTIGPLLGGVVGSGNAVATGSVELARPFLASMPSLWGAMFVDVGGADNELGSIKPSVGYGLGVRWRSPVGPLRVDYAWARETNKGRLHFTVGIAF